jgi:hypothetical protein
MAFLQKINLISIDLDFNDCNKNSGQRLGAGGQLKIGAGRAVLPLFS